MDSVEFWQYGLTVIGVDFQIAPHRAPLIESFVFAKFNSIVASTLSKCPDFEFPSKAALSNITMINDRFIKITTKTSE